MHTITLVNQKVLKVDVKQTANGGTLYIASINLGSKKNQATGRWEGGVFVKYLTNLPVQAGDLLTGEGWLEVTTYVSDKYPNGTNQFQIRTKKDSPLIATGAETAAYSRDMGTDIPF